MLLIPALAMCGLSAGQTGKRLTLREIREEIQRSYEFGDYDRTIELLLELEQRTPDRAVTAYNLACCYAMTGRKDDAIQWLRRSGERGFDRHRLVVTTDNLERVRSMPGYAEAVARIEANAKDSLAKFVETAPPPDPVVILPPHYDASKPAALIVSLHGYGGTAPPVADVWQRAAADVGAIVIAPRAVHKVRNAGYEWGELEEAEFLVSRAIEHVRARHAIDPKRVVLTGFSQGAYVALELGLRYPDRFCGIVPVCGGGVPIATSLPPADSLPRFFFMAGDRDGALHDMQRAAAVLEAHGAKAKIVVHAKTAHRFPEDSVAATRQALRFVLVTD